MKYFYSRNRKMKIVFLFIKNLIIQIHTSDETWVKLLDLCEFLLCLALLYYNIFVFLWCTNSFFLSRLNPFQHKRNIMFGTQGQGILQLTCKYQHNNNVEFKYKQNCTESWQIIIFLSSFYSIGKGKFLHTFAVSRRYNYYSPCLQVALVNFRLNNLQTHLSPRLICRKSHI